MLIHLNLGGLPGTPAAAAFPAKGKSIACVSFAPETVLGDLESDSSLLFHAHTCCTCGEEGHVSHTLQAPDKGRGGVLLEDKEL